MKVKLVVPLILLIMVNATNEYRNWNPHRIDHPYIYLRNYQFTDFNVGPVIMGDTILLSALNTNRKRVQFKILLYHNIFRSRVKPSASNMLKMKWHKGAANTAQRWANECKVLVHDNSTGRYVGNYGECGQNIFIATHKVPWLFAIKTWWLEKYQFIFGDPRNDLLVIGHYTQMVWATSHEVGCGISKCYQLLGNSTKGRVFYNYVCNYCPAGNRPGKVNRPYELGTPCGLCKRNCKIKLCLNSCPFANLWSNCDQLYKAHPRWLCHTNTPKGRQRYSYCKATCACKNKIHD